MPDPEILDPTNDPANDPGDDLLAAAVTRAARGHIVRVHREPARGPLPPRTRVEVDGAGGTLVVESTLLMTVRIELGPMRMTLAPIADSQALAAVVEERVRAIIAEELVGFYEQMTPSLRRTAIFAVRDDALERLVDSGIEPGDGIPGTAALVSFRGRLSRAPTPDERKRIDKLCGGWLGALKRKAAIGLLARIGRALGAEKEAASPEKKSDLPMRLR